MRTITLTFIVLLGLVHSCLANYNIEQVLFVPWGEETGQIKLQETPAGWQSLESFQVIDSNSYLMPSNSKQILIFSSQKQNSILKTGILGAIDFKMSLTGELEWVMTADMIYNFQGQTSSIFWVNPWNQRPNSRILRVKQNISPVLLNLSETIIPGSNRHFSIPGVLNSHGQYGKMIRQSDSEMLLLINDKPLATLAPEQGIWGSGQYLGVNDRGDHYILLETIYQSFPLILKREILIIDSKGQSLTALEIPSTIHVPVNREFQIDPDGSVYELITTGEGVSIIKWNFSGKHPDSFVRTALPSQFQNIPVRPFTGDSMLPSKQTPDGKSSEGKTRKGILGINQGYPEEENDRLDFPPVGREEALTTAAGYVDLIWTATAANITNGEINDPNGHAVQTPAWVQLGQNQKMAYQWGGFSTINGYVNGLANGKYAGDMATSAVSSYAVGVDCSGFVCRCWNMPQHYSTWMMSNTTPLITLPLSSWYDLRAGDAIHKVGHVRLLVLWNTNGTLLAVEAGGNWITHYQSYSISQLSAYQPRSYVNMEGMPATLEQPVLASLCNRVDSTIVSWSLDDTVNIQGLHLYTKDIFQTTEWELLDDNLIPLLPDRTVLPVSEHSLAYQLKSVSTGESITESYPSDSYALANKGSEEKLLIVDGFDRTSGSYPFPYHDFALRMAKALGNFTFSYETTDNDAILHNLVTLDDYTAVFWLLGDESTLNETFSEAEQTFIEAYLTQGGKLFVSGSEIAWDLGANGNSNDQAFLHNYLKAAYGADNSQSYVISGVSGTPFAGLSLNFDDGNDGVYEEDYPDAFLINGGSQAILRYANNMIAGTAYTGTFGNGNTSGQVILLGIPFETIYSETQRLDLISDVLTYFGLSTVLPVADKALKPETRLLKPFPSPFNSTTQIRFQLAQAGPIDLRVFDILGREVALLSDADFEAGPCQLSFNANGLDGGLYFVQLRTKYFHQTQKIIYLN